MKGLQGNMMFTNYLTAVERQTLKRLAEIEQEDADRCESCGGEDCVCCEYYIDRQKWVEPEDLFGMREPGDPMYDDYFYYDDWDYEDEEE